MSKDSGWRLVIVGRDYRMGTITSTVDAWVRSEGISKRRPAHLSCSDCMVFSEAWGAGQVAGFRETHNGHRGLLITVKRKPPKKRKRRRGT